MVVSKKIDLKRLGRKPPTEAERRSARRILFLGAGIAVAALVLGIAAIRFARQPVEAGGRTPVPAVPEDRLAAARVIPVEGRFAMPQTENIMTSAQAGRIQADHLVQKQRANEKLDTEDRSTLTASESTINALRAGEIGLE